MKLTATWYVNNFFYTIPQALDTVFNQDIIPWKATKRCIATSFVVLGCWEYFHGNHPQEFARKDIENLPFNPVSL